MSSLVGVRVPTEAFALTQTFERLPAVEFHARGLVDNGSDGDVALLGAEGAAAPAVREALAADATTAGVDLVAERARGPLFRVRLATQSRALPALLVADDGAVLGGRGTSDGWSFRLLFPGHVAASTARDAWSAHDVSVDWIQPLDGAVGAGGPPVTDTQTETLETALDTGYYAVPRDAAIDDLAAELGVSHQALSERLRRGHRALVESCLGV